jgi:hypothetical protein
MLRGALGGALGGFVVWLIAMLADFLRLGYIPYPYLYVSAIPLALLFGGVIGAIIGTTIWVLRRLTAREVGPVRRGIIGFVVALVAVGMFAYVLPEERGSTREPLS